MQTTRFNATYFANSRTIPGGNAELIGIVSPALAKIAAPYTSRGPAKSSARGVDRDWVDRRRWDRGDDRWTARMESAGSAGDSHGQGHGKNSCRFGGLVRQFTCEHTCL